MQQRGSPSSTAGSSAAASSAPGSATPAPSPTATGPLTIKQAKRAYAEIVDPYNELVDKANRDAQDGAPFAQYQADLRALIAGEQEFSRKLAQVRWPARVQGYIDAMRATDIPADIHCDRAEIKAGSYGELDTVDASNSWCQQVATSSATNADQVRQLLHLPPVSN
jgi:hypothetical protein